MWARFETLESRWRTEQARFQDKHSRIGHRSDGSEFWDLRGADVGIQRNRVFNRDKLRCQGCGLALMLAALEKGVYNKLTPGQADAIAEFCFEFRCSVEEAAERRSSQ